MSLLDMRTIIFSYTITAFICMIVMFVLWLANRRHFAGLAYWMADYIMQFAGLLLLALRGAIPEALSVTASNAAIIAGTILLYIGLGWFSGKRSRQRYNWILLAVFILIHSYFTYVVPSLMARNIALSSVLFLVSAQIAWLMLRRVAPVMRRISMGPGFVFVAYCAVSIVRLLADIMYPPGNDLFHAGFADVLSLLTYEMLYIVLTFALFLLVNQRLFMELQNDIVARSEAETALRESEEKFSKAFRSSPDAILITRHKDGSFVEVNDGFSRITGYTREEIVGQSTRSLSVWADPRDRERLIANLVAAPGVNDREIRIRSKSGKLVVCRYSGEILRIGDEECILSVIRDVTEHVRNESLLRLRLELWEYAAVHPALDLMQKTLDEVEELTGSSISFYHLVEEAQNTLTLQAWSTRTRDVFCKAEAGGMHYSMDKAGVWVDCVRERRPVIHNDYASLPNKKGMPEGHAKVQRELVVPTMRDGKVVSILGVGNKPTEYDEGDMRLVEYMADVVWTIVTQKRSEEKIHRLNDQLARLAMTDELTGLSNRRAFFMLGREEIKKAKRFGTPLAMLMLDIDRFKEVNDTYGHETGDTVLQYIAKSVRESVREVDVAARIGGEEFGVLLPSTKTEFAVILAERLREKIETEGCVTNGNRLNVTVSIGVAEYDRNMQNLDELIRIADSAMYRAKNEGRNRVRRSDNDNPVQETGGPGKTGG